MKLKQIFLIKHLKTCLKIIALFVVLLFLYVLSFINGRPTIDTDYLAELNKIDMPENYKPEDNAWPDYKKAFELYKEPDYANNYSFVLDNRHYKDFTDFNDMQRKFITDWIEQNQPAWEQFVQASLKPYFYFKYKVKKLDKTSFYSGLFEESDLPALMRIETQAGNFRDFFILCRWRVMNTAKTNPQQAVEDSFALLQAAFHLHQEKLFISRVIELACHSVGNECLLKVISENELSPSMLGDMQIRLTKMYESHPVTLNLEGERLTFLDIVQYMFTKGGLGDGHLIPESIPLLTPMIGIVISMSEPDPEPTRKEKLMFAVLSMLHTRRNKTIANYNELFDRIQKMQDITPYEIKQSGYSTGFEPPFVFNYRIHFKSFIGQSRNFLVSIFTPALERLTKMIQEKRTEYEATITILAIERYRMEKGNFPQNLEELLDNKYLSKLPKDPFSDKSLIYKNEGDDFKLYSVGEDFKDDGGNSDARDLKWGKSSGKTGDAVFWPVQ